MKTAIAIGLLISVILISGCTQETTTTTSTSVTTVTTTTVPAVDNEIEDQAVNILNQELDNATAGIDTSDIESLIS